MSVFIPSWDPILKRQAVALFCYLNQLDSKSHISVLPLCPFCREEMGREKREYGNCIQQGHLKREKRERGEKERGEGGGDRKIEE